MERFIPQIDAIEKALAGAKTTEPSSDFDLNQDQPKFLPSELRNAAVLIPLFAGPNGLEVIFTKRSTAMRHHPGQISFPGGKQDVTDTSLAHTALREAEEEIGLGQKDVKMIGALPKHVTVTSFLVRPYVGLVPDDFKAKLSTGEVSEIFTAPLNHLLHSENYQIEGRIWQGQQRYYFTVPYGPYYIWGATARMLRMLADIVGNQDAY
ncbi:MAG: CoA pyrophosphatase [Amylibacter sp.]|nr:CoA pyrophosphatase [Amylibacter sp.]